MLMLEIRANKNDDTINNNDDLREKSKILVHVELLLQKDCASCVWTYFKVILLEEIESWD
jgi:hypothetical protein